MNSTNRLLAEVSPLIQFQDFLIMTASLLLGVILVFVWFRIFGRKRQHKRRKRRHSDAPKLNPTLAESGGLPPPRARDQSDTRPPP